MIAKLSATTPDQIFTLNGVEYQRGLYTLYYNNITLDESDTVIKSQVNVGIKSIYEFIDVLVQPIPIYTWSDGTSNFSDLDTLTAYLHSVIGSPISGISISQQVNQYGDLNPGVNIGDLAYVENSQGTPWLPGTLGGTYYPAGWYVWDGVDWVSDRNAIANEFNNILLALDDKAPLDGGSLTNTTVNGVVLESAGSASFFLNQQGNYVAGGGGGATQLSDLTDVVSAINTNRFALMANGTTGYVGRAIEKADISDFANDTITLLGDVTGVGVTSITTTIADGAVSKNTLSQNLDDAIAFFDGSAFDDPFIQVTSDGVTITLSLEANGGGDIRLLFSDGFYTLDCTPADTVTLTAGTDTSPQINYVYVLQSTKTLTASTSGFPATEHAPIATVLCQSAASLQTDGAYKVHQWTDHTFGSNGMGHLAHLNYWIRQQDATWQDGVALTPTVGASQFEVATSAGNVLQLHPHPYPAFNTATGSELYMVNYPGDNYRKALDLTQTYVDVDANGTALGAPASDFYNLVIWGVVSEESGDCKLMLNLPDGAYANNNGDVATLDTDRTAIYTIPLEYRGTGFLIARLTVQENAGTYTIIQNEDLRGLFPSTAAGSVGGSSSTFADNIFRIQDDGDSTKEIAFQASGITTATTRTITMPDKDVDLGNIVTLSKGITIPDPVATDDATIFFTPVAITITDVRSHITGTTNVVFNIQHASTRTGTGLDVFTSDITLTSTAGQSNNSGFNDETIPANSWVWLNVVSVSGTPTMFHTTLIYTED